MGICLDGIVEIWCEPSQYHPNGLWDGTAEIRFGKNYALSALLSDMFIDAGRNWSKRSESTGVLMRMSSLALDVLERDNSHDHLWVTSSELEAVLEVKPDYDPGYDHTLTARAAVAFMKVYEAAGSKVRILFYRH